MELLPPIILVVVLACIFYVWRKEQQHPAPEAPVFDSKPKQSKRPPLTDAECEAMKQADEVWDVATYFAIQEGTYNGPLPKHDGFYWSDLYPDIYRTKIAGINFSKGIRDLAGMYFDALLVPEPKNKFDPNAIKIVHAQDKRKLGYIPADETDSVRSWVNNQFPYPCRAHIDEREEWDSDTDRERTFLIGQINFKKPNN